MQTKALTTQRAPAQIALLNDVMKQAGKAANKAAARHTFGSDTARKADNTIRRKRADLALFETFLQSANIPARDLFDNPQAWRGVTWGIVEAFREWQLKQGYAIASINAHLSTVRTYAKLAAKAGAITPDELRMIQTVQGFSRKESKHVDTKRRADNIETRRGTKKAQAIIIPEDIAQAMATEQPDTPQGRRDALLMCLLLEHGLRISEAAILTRAAFDLKAGTITVYRPKVDKTQTFTMTPATREAARHYLKLAPEAGIIWRKSNKGKSRLSNQMSETSATRALTKRVELLGRKHGIEGLSAHDCRHTAATFEARNKTAINDIVDMFGWNSYAMAKRYIETAHIANAGSARLK